MLDKISSNKKLGYICLFRSIKRWEWYDDINVRLLFIELLITCNWKEKKWRGEVVKPGEIITSLRKLSNEVGISKSKIETALKKLILTDEISLEIGHNFTKITLLKFDKYQNNNITNRTPIGRQSDANRTPIGRQSDILNKDNKENKENKRVCVCNKVICECENEKIEEKKTHTHTPTFFRNWVSESSVNLKLFKPLTKEQEDYLLTLVSKVKLTEIAGQLDDKISTGEYKTKNLFTSLNKFVKQALK